MNTAIVEDVECVVIGAGVVGLAAARALAMAGREVIVLEAEDMIGSMTSARNSEVIHAGIYYPAGSLKARVCVEGRRWLYGLLRRARYLAQAMRQAHRRDRGEPDRNPRGHPRACGGQRRG